MQFILLSVVTFLCVEASSPSSVVSLDDSNFEHLTQVSTGATTGDWLVNFYAPWCDHCLRLQPVWEELAAELEGDVIVAKVNIDANTLLKERFRIKSYPTIKLFRKGQMFSFEGGGRATEDFAAFVRSGCPPEEGEVTPPPFTWLQEKLRWLTLQQRFAAERLRLAKRDIAKGKYWSTHTVVVSAAAVAVLLVVAVLFALFAPAKPNMMRGSSKKDKKMD